MPVLLLASGDPQARALLKKAIEARYGVLPPAIAALKLSFKGRARVKVGPMITWVPVEATAQFEFPTALRWDFTVKPMGLPVQRGVEAFDGQTYRTLRGGGKVSEATLEDQTNHLRGRLWAVAALLLTPLGEDFVNLEETGETSFSATHKQSEEVVNVRLRPDYGIEAVDVTCYNPDAEKRQRFTLVPSTEHIELGGLRLPLKITASWDNAATFEVSPTAADNLVSIPPGVFSLNAEASA